MSSRLIVKSFSVLLICLLSLYIILPNFFDNKFFISTKRINLGLDLKGGASLLLNIDLDFYFKEKLGMLADEIKETLLAKDIKCNIQNEPLVKSSVIPVLDTGIQKKEAWIPASRAGMTAGGAGEKSPVIPVLDTGIQKKDVWIPVSATRMTPDRVGEKVIVNLSNPDDYKKASVLISKMNSNLELNRKDSSIFISYKPHYKNSLINEVVAESINNVQRRLDTLGTKEVSVQKQGQNKILVQVPGVENTEQIKSLLGKTAKLSFHLANNNVGKIQDIDHETTVLLKDSLGNSYPIFRKTEISGDALVNASVRFGSLGKPTVHFKFDSTASKKFAKITKENVGKPFAIVLDNRVLTVPLISEPILDGRGEIKGNFTEKQASELAILLKSGALPAPLKIIEEKNVGPSLGEESIKAGEMAAMISIIAVSLFIIITYGKLGLLASVALLFNVILILLILTLLEATLTLPGIAGIALTVGMAVDANVLIFERIREEIKSGKRVERAIEEGFKNAIKTILDSNITTLIAAGIMFIIGSGAIRGFSVTLSIGILCSMFSAITVTKLLIELCVNPKKLVL